MYKINYIQWYACRSSRYIVCKIHYIQWYACRSSRYDYSWEDADSESELYALELEVPFIAISTAILVLKILGGGRLNPTLSLFAGGWDAVDVDGCGTGTGGRGRLGVEN